MILPFGETKPQLGSRVYIAESADIIGQVILGDEASVFFQSVIRADINSISIGARSNIQDHCVLHVASNLGVEIGEDVSIGHGCIVHACILRDRILVGMGSIIMDGVEVESDCLIAAGSLLAKGKKFPARSLIMGSPARVIRALTDDEVASLKKLAEKYIRVKDVYLHSKPWAG